MPTINSYTIGKAVRATATIRDFNSALIDPTALVFKILDPSSVITSYTYGVDPEVVRDGVGVYHIDFEVTEKGTWYYRCEATGNVVVAEEHELLGAESKFV